MDLNPSQVCEFKIGDFIMFGNCSQTEDGNDKTPIRWRVLDKEPGKLFVISEKAIESTSYHYQKSDVTWETCDLREWLNGKFFSEAFSIDEQSIILNTQHSMNATYDKIFLLDISEVEKYFSSNEERMCVPTKSCVSNGIFKNRERNTCRWWLRSSGGNQCDAAVVNDDGSINYNGFYVAYFRNGVRPCMWIDVNSLDLTKIYDQIDEELEQTETNTNVSKDILSVKEYDSTKVADETTTKELLYAEKGDIVKFGTYQKNAQNTDKLPIEWRVLAKKPGRILVICERALDCQQYNDKMIDVTWETSTLREWLNTTFLKVAFSVEEQTNIQCTTVPADVNPEWDTYYGNVTEDKVFILSISEANTYFSSNEERMCVPTEYAILRDTYINNEGDKPACYWWLRSPGESQDQATSVDYEGEVGQYGDDVFNDYYGVRPAMWIKLGTVEENEVEENEIHENYNAGEKNKRNNLDDSSASISSDILSCSEEKPEKTKHHIEKQNPAKGNTVCTSTMDVPESVEDKLAKVTEILKERCASGKQKMYSISELSEQNKDLPIDNIGRWSKKVFNKTGTEYLREQGIIFDEFAEFILENERREAEAKTLEERLEAELNAPIETIIYEPEVYSVPEISIFGEKANEWMYADDPDGQANEVWIKDYLGSDNHIVIPTFINGKRVTNLESFGFENCKASIVEIPGSIKNLAGSLGFHNENIQTVIVGEGVETIGEGCFFHLKNLKTVKVSKSVIGVADNVFEQTPWFEAQDDLVIIGSVLAKVKAAHSVINVPQGIKTIGYEAVGSLTLRKVVLPKSVTTLCEDAFLWSKNINEFVFSDSLTNIGHGSFGNNKWTENLGDDSVIINNQLYQFKVNGSQVVIPDGVTKICNKVFEDNKDIKSVVFPKTLKIIGKSAFDGCENITIISVPECVERLEDSCFSGCYKLSSITLPDSLSVIDEEVFFCSALTEIALGKSVNVIGSGAFMSCEKLKSFTMNDKVRIIGKRAFSGCSSLLEIEIPSTVKRIGPGAFSGCRSLEKVSLNSEITEISKNLFEDCTSLINIVIPDTVTEIREGAFRGCTNLRSVTLPAGIILIGKDAFRGCTALERIIIPFTVKTIEDNAFKDCTSLSEVEMSDSIENFGIDVFTNSPYLKKSFGDFVIMDGVLSKYLGSDKEVTIPDNVSTIGQNAFEKALHVEMINIPNTVKNIAGNLFGIANKLYFGDPPQLKKVVIGDGVTSIGNDAFAECDNLTEVVFGKGLLNIGKKAFSNCKKLKSIDLGETEIKEIQHGAFEECKNVKNIVFPSTIEIVGHNAFFGIDLDVVQLPKSVKIVENYAFNSVTELVVFDTIEKLDAFIHRDDFEDEEQDRNNKKGYHVTVLSANTGNVRYRIFYDPEERFEYENMMFSAWGKNASFSFEEYDDYFMKTRNIFGRTEMAFCRIQYPEGLSTIHRRNYEAYLERCLYIERSARRTAELIANDDSVERLKLLSQYKAIDQHNIGWIREQFETKQAKKCLAFLDENYLT